MITLIQDLQDSVGCEIGLSSWLTVDQSMIDDFAEVTNDRQFIHVDPERASKTDFGGTIAHGFLTLSLLPTMISQCAQLPGLGGTGVNYGLDFVRFLSPTRVGSRIRGRFVLVKYDETRPGSRKLTWDVTIEIEGQEKPALRATWHTLRLSDASPAK